MARQRKYRRYKEATVIWHRLCSFHALTKWPAGVNHLKSIYESPVLWMSTDLSLFCFLFLYSVGQDPSGGGGWVEMNGSVGLPQRLKKDKRFLGRKKIYDTSLQTSICQITASRSMVLFVSTDFPKPTDF